MSSVFATFRALLSNPWLRWLAAPAVLVAVIGSVVGANSLPPTVQLATEPLYARGARAKPTLTLALSVEFPTVGAQYLDAYSPSSEYVGYFDAAGCYSYVDLPTEVVAAGLTMADYKRFDRTGDAAKNTDGVSSAHTCGGTAFSGNFMNWASSSAIDILRLGLSGGDRVIDTDTGFTVLQRAYLPNGFWNSSNFPSKVLKAGIAAGAVPALLLKTPDGSAWANDVFIANCANHIAFGTRAEGNCTSQGHNADLGNKIGGFPLNGSYSGTLPEGFTYRADEAGSYTTTSQKQVAYGANSNWAVRTLPAGTVGCNNATFGDPLNGVVKKCYDRDPASSTGIGVTSDGYLYARVQVCRSNAGTLSEPRPSLCLKYPNNTYKPVGNLQKYSDRLRVAAFGYLNDSTGNPNERYGGVLRAPMKFVGPTTYNANFSLSSSTNPDSEWNEQTGVLKVNPTPWPNPAASEARSGVINYLNQFGRTGTSPEEPYKKYDPVGELYYESLRYLQGLQPTAAALPASTASPSDVTNWKDGFPVYSTWIDPHPPTSNPSDYSCVRNNILAIGDTNTHNDKTIPGNPSSRAVNDSARPANAAANEPDFYQWTKVVGAFESNHAEVTYLDGKGVSRNVSNPNQPANTDRWGMENQNIGADSASYYMAGMAYWANTHDIRGTDWKTGSTDANGVTKQRPGMRVTTYVLDVNEFGQQNDPSRRHNNQFFLAAKYGGFNDSAAMANPYFSAASSAGGAPISGNTSWESAPNSDEAKNYFLSSSAQAVLKALDAIFESISTEANSIAGGAIATQRLSSTPDFIYQAQFNPADWSGDVAAVPVSASASGGVVSVGSSASAPAGHWTSAASVLNARAAESRNIYVGSSSSTFQAVPFLWGNLGDTIKNALKTPLGGTSPSDTDDVGKTRLNYLRGDRSAESGTLRKRGSTLGDIVNSGIVYSGPLSDRFKNVGDGTFYANNKSRPETLYVGANDGMLHAFNVKDGSELFAYIPSWVVPKLSALTSPAYAHQSYVDATPAVAEVPVGSQWKTVLVSGTGGGGQGVFALDVSSSDKFAADKVMWEFTDADDSALGNVIGVPQLLPMRVGKDGATQYFAVFGSGVNNYAADGRASATGAAAIFLLSLDKAAGDKWVYNKNYFRIDLPDPDTGIASGLANFTARVDDAGLVSSLYAGDLQGNLWKLDFTLAKGDASKWTLATLVPFQNGSTPLPFYIARDGTNSTARQPITMPPTLVYGPNGGIIVTFGTGKFLEVADISGTYTPQSVYAVLDNGTSTVDDSALPSAVPGRASLSPGAVSGGIVSVAAFSWGRPSSGTSVRAGWYLDLPQSVSAGERQISGFELLGGSAVFGTVIPAARSCEDGSGNLYVVDLLTGAGTTQTSTVGIFAQPLIRSVDDSSLVRLTVSDTNGRRVQTIRSQPVLFGSAGVSAPASLSEPIKTYVGRLSWRELAVRR